MRTLGRILGYGLLISILGVGLGLAAILGNVGGIADKLLPRILSEVTGYPVQIKGPITFSWSDNPVIALGGLRVDRQEPDKTMPVLELEHGRIEISLDDALVGRLVIPRGTITGLDATLRSDIIANAMLPNASLSIALVPILGEILIDGARVRLLDESSGELFEVNVERFELRGETSGPAATVSAKGTLQSQPFTLTGKTVQPVIALAEQSAIPITLDLESNMIGLTITGKVDPFVRDPSIDIRTEFVAYEIRELANMLYPDIDLDGLTKVTARISGSLLTPRAEQIDAQILFRNGGGLQLKGQIANIREFDGIDLEGSAEASSSVALVKKVLKPPFEPEFISIQSSISGSVRALSLHQLSATFEDRAGGTATAKGKATLQIGKQGLRLDAAQAQFEMIVPDIQQYIRQPGTNHPRLGKIQTSGDLSIDGDGEVTLRQASLSAPLFGEAKAKVSGRIGQLNIATGNWKTDLDLKLDGSTGQAGDVANRLGLDTPFLRTLKLAARVTGDTEQFALSDIDIESETVHSAILQARGSIAQVTPTNSGMRAKGLDLLLQATSPNTGWITKWLAIPAPELGAARATVRATGNLEKIQFEALDLATTMEDMIATRITGTLGQVNLSDGERRLKTINLSVEGDVQTAAALTHLLGRKAPLIEGLRMSGLLTGDSARITLGGIEISGAGEAGLSFNATGSVQDLLARKGVEISVNSMVDPALLAGLADAGTLGKIRTKARLTDQDGSLGLEALQAQTEGSDLWKVETRGQIDDLLNADEIELRTRLEIPNPAAFSTKIGGDPIEMEHTSFDGVLAGSNESLNATGSFVVGATRFDGTVSGAWLDGRPTMKGQLVSEVVHLADFGLKEPELPLADAKETPATAGPVGPVFDMSPLPFESLRAANIELDARIEEVDGAGITIDRLTSSIRLKNGVLDLDPLTFSFVGGDLATRVRVDAVGDTPVVQLAADADDLDLETVFKTIGADVPVDGELDITTKLTASGITTRALAGSLSGNLDMAVARGRARIAFFELLGVDLFRWMLSPGALEGVTDINCLIVRLDAKDGRAEMGNFILDTPGTRTGGTGSVDLGSETVDLVFVPKPKRRLLKQLTTPVAVRGPLRDPSVDLNPVGLTADVVARIATSPLSALEGILSMVIDRGADQTNPCATK
jgi:uncharacterized protein involved in outer membrane biogenesis